MSYSKSFNYDKVILNTGQFAYGIQKLIEALLDYSKAPTIDMIIKMPDGVTSNKRKLTYKDLEEVSDLTKQTITINFTHKKNGWYYLSFSPYLKGIHLALDCENALLFNQIDQVVKAILSLNFSKSAFDKKISDISNINVDGNIQREENASQKLDSTIDLSNANLKDSTINISNTNIEGSAVKLSNTKIEDSIVNLSNKTIEKSSSKNLWFWIVIAAAVITIISGIIGFWKFYLE